MFKLDLEWTVEGRGGGGASGKVRRLLIYDSKLVSIQTPGWREREQRNDPAGAQTQISRTISLDQK